MDPNTLMKIQENNDELQQTDVTVWDDFLLGSLLCSKSAFFHIVAKILPTEVMLLFQNQLLFEVMITVKISYSFVAALRLCSITVNF